MQIIIKKKKLRNVKIINIFKDFKIKNDNKKIKYAKVKHIYRVFIIYYSLFEFIQCLWISSLD